jgi:hypothetical protein
MRRTSGLMLLSEKLAAVCPIIPLMTDAHTVRPCATVTLVTRGGIKNVTSKRGVTSHPKTSVLLSSAKEAAAHTTALKDVTG